MGNHPYTTLIEVRKLLVVRINKALFLANDFAKIAKLLKSDCIETIFTMIYNKSHGYNILFLNVMKNNFKKNLVVYIVSSRENLVGFVAKHIFLQLNIK